MFKKCVRHAWRNRRRHTGADRRLLVESLEPRRVLATASIDLADGVLEIVGTGNADTISVACDAAGDVVATIRKSDGSLLLQETYDRIDITSLVARALGGNDRVSNSTNIPDTMEGGEGDDVLRGGSANSTLIGANGNDILIGGLSGDAGFGGDQLYGDSGRDQLFADGATLLAGRWIAKSLEHADVESLAGALNALADADVLSGGPDDDILYGGGGMDLLLGGDGNDTLSGAECIDLLFGQAGDDALFGGTGDDYLNGGRGRDKLSGNDGDDILYGGDLNEMDELRGGAGSDQFVFGGQLGQEWWSQEVRDYSNNDDEWIYLWLLSDEDVETYTQPALT